jgi:phage baseplate assembly protein W
MIHSQPTGVSPMQSLEAMFAADVNFVANHPNIPQLLLSAVGRTTKSPLKLMIATFVRRYEQRLSSVIAEAQQRGEIRATLDEETAARLFIATIQNLVFRALIRDELDKIREAAPAAFASYRACVETTR